MFRVYLPIHGLIALALLTGMLILETGCQPRQPGADGTAQRTFIDIGTSPGGVFNPVGIAVAECLNEHKGQNNWKVQAKGTQGSQENIRLLDSGEMQLAISNSAITHFAHQGQADWDRPYRVNSVVTLAPNVAMFVTRRDSGIRSMADLKGKTVVCGPPGAGFDMFIGPILEAHGLSFDDFEKTNASQSETVDILADGQADAAFLGGAIPAPPLQRLCNEQDVFFIPFDEAAVDSLIQEYPFFWRVTIPQDKYPDLDGDYRGINVGSMHLITSADESDEEVYQVAKILWENRKTIGHPVPKNFITEENAARFTGTPFHPGAIRFYREIGIWPEDRVE